MKRKGKAYSKTRVQRGGVDAPEEKADRKKPTGKGRLEEGDGWDAILL